MFWLRHEVTRRKLRCTAAAIVAGGALLLAGCTGNGPTVVRGSTVVVASAENFTSTNTSTVLGSSALNKSVAYATNAGFTYFGAKGELVADTSFGSIQKISDDPLVVNYRVADGVEWSDGTPLDATDLLLAWAAGSGSYNDPDVDPAEFSDAETGEFGAVATDLVYFDTRGTTGGLSRVTTFPEVSEDELSITLHYDTVYADWEGAFWGPTTPGLPAHIVGQQALGSANARAAKDAVHDAIAKNDRTALAKVSQQWNSGFTVTDLPKNADQLVSSGAYTVTDAVAGQYVTLEANENYRGMRQPQVEQVTIRTVTNPLAAVQAMLVGAVQVISPTPSPEVLQALGSMDVTVERGYRDLFEHLDLVSADSLSGVFDDAKVRQAFLMAVPRAQIVDDLVGPVYPDTPTRDSFLFLPGTANYRASVAANGSKDFADVDIAGAIAALADAGVASPTVCILFDPKDTRRSAEFALIMESASQAGFVVTDCSSDDWKSRLGAADSYDAVLYGSPTPTTATQLTATFSTEGSENFARYSNPDVDKLIAQFSVELDRAERAALLREIDAILWSDAYGAPLFQNPTITAFDQKHVANVSPSTSPPGVFWNVWDWAVVDGSS